jgi:hypothetical protein
MSNPKLELDKILLMIQLDFLGFFRRRIKGVGGGGRYHFKNCVPQLIKVNKKRREKKTKMKEKTHLYCIFDPYNIIFCSFYCYLWLALYKLFKVMILKGTLKYRFRCAIYTLL